MLRPYPTEEDFRKYIGIDFVHGSTDCYGLIRRVYDEMFGIPLRNYARPDNWWDYPDLYDLYMENFENEGFRLVDFDLNSGREVGDIILMAIHSEKACHAGIYIGNGKILHHFYGRKSSIENYCRLWKNTTVAVIRHKDLKFAKTIEEVDIREDVRVKSFILLQQQRSGEGGNSNQNGAS